MKRTEQGSRYEDYPWLGRVILSLLHSRRPKQKTELNFIQKTPLNILPRKTGVHYGEVPQRSDPFDMEVEVVENFNEISRVASQKRFWYASTGRYEIANLLHVDLKNLSLDDVGITWYDFDKNNFRGRFITPRGKDYIVVYKKYPLQTKISIIFKTAYKDQTDETYFAKAIIMNLTANDVPDWIENSEYQSESKTS